MENRSFVKTFICNEKMEEFKSFSNSDVATSENELLKLLTGSSLDELLFGQIEVGSLEHKETADRETARQPADI